MRVVGPAAACRVVVRSMPRNPRAQKEQRKLAPASRAILLVMLLLQTSLLL